MNMYKHDDMYSAVYRSTAQISGEERRRIEQILEKLRIRTDLLQLTSSIFLLSDSNSSFAFSRFFNRFCALVPSDAAPL